LDKVKLDSSLTAKAKAAIEAEKEDEKPKQTQKPTEDLPIVKYLDTQACTIKHLFERLIVLNYDKSRYGIPYGDRKVFPVAQQSRKNATCICDSGLFLCRFCFSF